LFQKSAEGPRASERAIRKASEADPAAQCARIAYTSMHAQRSEWLVQPLEGAAL
jgi:hypothetical protein